MKKLIRMGIVLLALFVLSLSSGSLAIAEHGDGDKPAGWSKGKKTGWHGSDVPPGQSKKHEKKARKEKKHKHEEKKEEKHEENQNQEMK